MDIAQNYIELNKKLIQTMVIKSELHARLINEEIKLKHPEITIDENDPTTWKYYLNIAGIDHSLNKEIYVTSFDTQEEILFNSYNLSQHKQTRKNYLIGTKNYYILLKKYPEEELYINGCLYPVDINVATNAKDLEILYYDKTLIEEQEISLINKLQEFIYGYDARWNVKSFITSDPIYPAAQHAIFTLNLLQKLINIRLNNCHTSEVHSFHIKNYLASHYGLDKYMSYMTLRQILFLYKNIRYIERNIGKVDTFKTLVQRLIEERKLVPLYEVSVKQLHTVDDHYLPNIQARKKNITSILNPTEKDYFTIETFENYQRPIAMDNDWYLDNFNQVIRHKLATDDTNTIKTKFLISDLIDYTDIVPYTFQESLFKHWASMSNTGAYNTYVQFYNTLNGDTNYLHVKDTFIYFLYLTKSYYEQIAETIPEDISNNIPEFLNSKRLKYIKPTINELLEFVPIDSRRKFENIAQEIIDRMPTLVYTINVDNYYDLCKEIYDYALWQWFLISNTHDLNSRAYIKAMCDYTFVDECIELNTSYTTYQQFLEDKGLPANIDQPLKVIQLLVNIYTASTGFVIDKYNILRNIQDMLVDALLLLSSYSINIIKQINSTKINLANWAAIRAGNEKIRSWLYDYIEPFVDVLNVGGSLKNDTVYDLNLGSTYIIHAKYGTCSSYEIIDIKIQDLIVTTGSVFYGYLNANSVNAYNEYLVSMTNEEISTIPVIN